MEELTNFCPQTEADSLSSDNTCGRDFSGLFFESLSQLL